MHTLFLKVVIAVEYVRMHAGNRYDDEVQNDGFSMQENAKDA